MTISYERGADMKRWTMTWLLWCTLCAVMLVAPARTAEAQPAPNEEPPAEASDAAPEATEDDEEEAEDEPDRYLAIVGGRVHTVSGPVLEQATILCRNDRIERIGQSITIPEDAEVIDAVGLDVYPGIVSVRLSGVLGGGSPDDSTNLYSLAIQVARASGITAAYAGNTVAKLTGETVDDMVLDRDVFDTIRYNSGNPNGRRQLRASFERLRKHKRDVARYEEEKKRNPDAEAPDDKWIRGEHQRNLRLLNGERVGLIDAGSANDILAACELAEEFGLRLVIRNAYEGWTVASEMARANVAAIITPRVERNPNERLLRPNGASIRNAKVLHDHGIRLAFVPAGSLFGPGHQISFGGLAGRDSAHIPLEAAFAVRGGLANDEAVQAITLDAARILGVDARIGSLEEGKDADIIVVDGDLLHYMTMVQKTIVNGRVVYDKDTDSLYDHIRPGGDRDAPPPDNHWPRKLGG